MIFKLTKSIKHIIQRLFFHSQRIHMDVRYEILSIKTNGNSFYRTQLLTLGLIPGVIFKTKCQAPLGGPIAISHNGCLIALRDQAFDYLTLRQVSE